jgi:hypothetical protein
MSQTSGLILSDSSMTPQIIREEGAGKAYQSVAQSTALAIQDAADNLRNINSISATAIGVAMAQFLETKDPAYAQAIDIATKMSVDAANTFRMIGTNAADVLNGYPSGQ